MKISKLVEQLKEVQIQHGDITVNITESGTEDNTVDLFGLSLLEVSDGKIESVLLCDRELHSAFVS